VRFATEKGVVEGDATNVRVVAGGGVTGEVAGRTWSVGSLRFLRATGHDVPGEDPDASADPVAFVGDGARLVGTFRLRDDVRHGAATIVASLQGEGVRLVVLLTGDGRGPAARLARTLGIDDVRSELLPEGKVDAVAGLERERGRVVMVGDGINDAAALARASVGVAVAATGNDAAMEAADVVLVGGEVGRLPWLLSHARRTLGIVRANVGVSLAVKVVWASLALAGASSLWGAVAADMGVSLVVVFNSLRLLSSSAPDCGDCRAARHH
jgi:Cd2+/Zn2+-exporting ATPase